VSTERGALHALVSLAAFGLALQALGASGKELLAPLSEQAVSDVVLATQLRQDLGSRNSVPSGA
jgi:hypothetical protein